MQKEETLVKCKSHPARVCHALHSHHSTLSSELASTVLFQYLSPILDEHWQKIFNICLKLSQQNIIFNLALALITHDNNIDIIIRWFCCL